MDIYEDDLSENVIKEECQRAAHPFEVHALHSLVHPFHDR